MIRKTYSLSVLILFAALFELFPPLWALPADDTFQCLADFTGPLVAISGDQGYTGYLKSTWAAQTRFDARGATWQSSLDPDTRKRRNCFPIQLGADWQDCTPKRFDLYADAKNLATPALPVCFAGGVITGTQPSSYTWSNVKTAAGETITLNSEYAIVDGVRVHNQEDAVAPMTSKYFEFRNSWVSYNRDDCIENDAFASGKVEDNLFDGCYVFWSSLNPNVANAPVAQGGGSGGLVKITHNLIRMQNMPGPYAAKSPNKHGYGHVIKTWDSRTPALELRDNIFWMEKPIDEGNTAIKLFSSDLKGCSNNVIVWTGGGSYPGPYPSQCFTVTTDKSVWDKAKQNWINCHPKVGRVSGDPSSDFLKCDTNAPGGKGESSSGATVPADSGS